MRSRRFEKEIQSGKLHPRDAKMKIAFEITSIFYGEADAQKAQDAFVKTFQQKEIPDEMPEFELQPGQTVLDVILAANMAASKSEARRLFDQKGVRLDGETIERGDTAFPHPGVLAGGETKISAGEVTKANGIAHALSRLLFIIFDHGKEYFHDSGIKQSSCAFP